MRFLSLFLFHSSNLIFFLIPSSLSIHPSLTLTFIDLICCPSLVKPPLFTLRTLSLWCLSFFPSLLFFHFPFIVGVSHFCFHPSLFSVHVFLLPPVIFPLWFLPFTLLPLLFPTSLFSSFPLSCHILTLAHALFYHSLLPFLPNLLFSSLLHLAFFYVLLPPSPSLSPVFLFPLPHLPFVFRFSLSPFIFFCCYPVLFLPSLVFSLIPTYFFFSFSFPFTLFVSVYPNTFYPISFSSYFPLLPYLLFLSLPLLLFPSVLFLKRIFLFVSWQNLTFNHWISHILHFWHNCIYLSFYIRMEKKHKENRAFSGSRGHQQASKLFVLM